VIIITCILVYLAWYFAEGTRRAKKRLPLTWVKARKAWDYEDHQIQEVKLITVMTLFFWPFVLIHDFIAPRLENAVSSGDAVQMKKKLDEQQAYIAKLEDEAGISHE
jgi:hypothetical protein